MFPVFPTNKLYILVLIASLLFHIAGMFTFWSLSRLHACNRCQVACMKRSKRIIKEALKPLKNLAPSDYHILLLKIKTGRFFSFEKRAMKNTCNSFTLCCWIIVHWMGWYWKQIIMPFFFFRWKHYRPDLFLWYLQKNHMNFPCFPHVIT